MTGLEAYNTTGVQVKMDAGTGFVGGVLGAISGFLGVMELAAKLHVGGYVSILSCFIGGGVGLGLGNLAGIAIEGMVRRVVQSVAQHRKEKELQQARTKFDI